MENMEWLKKQTNKQAWKNANTGHSNKKGTELQASVSRGLL